MQLAWGGTVHHTIVPQGGVMVAEEEVLQGGDMVAAKGRTMGAF